MRLLLDTHAILWWLTDDPQLSQPVRQALLSQTNEVWVSAASAWEVSSKQRLGKLAGLPPVQQWFRELTALDGFAQLDITAVHALRAGAYPAVHRDPFDRMLAAQAELEQMVLVTCDAQLAEFSCRRFW